MITIAHLESMAQVQWELYLTFIFAFVCVCVCVCVCVYVCVCVLKSKWYDKLVFTVLRAKSDSGVMFCLQSYHGFIIDRSLGY